MGNGKTINIYTDAWTSNNPIILSQNTYNLTKVAGLIDDNKNWKTNIVWNTFSKENTIKILATHIPREEVDDGVD